MWIYQRNNWPNFKWDNGFASEKLATLHKKQGILLGQMEELGFTLKSDASMQMVTQDVLKSSLIEGENLPKDEVRSSVARRMGLEIGGLVNSSREVEGVVDMMLDATIKYNERLTKDRLLGWHNSLFPAGKSGMHSITVGLWRDNTRNDPMQVVSGAIGREVVHFQAPDADRLEEEMRRFLMWLNGRTKLDPLLKAAIAHLWFVTLHPFDDGNGRIARAVTDMLLARSDDMSFRFYSMSSSIEKDKKNYYAILEKTQRGDLDVSEWVMWFLNRLEDAFGQSHILLNDVLFQAKFWHNPELLGINNRQKNMLKKLLDDFQGKLTSSKWAKMTKTSQDTAGRDINDLIKKGILKKDDSGGRSTSYSLVRD
ncbi:Fic family protein [Ekhidna sp.]